MPEKKKMGRPTDNPKGTSVHIRLDQQCVDVLNQYSAQENITRAEAIRRGIVELRNLLKK